MLVPLRSVSLAEDTAVNAAVVTVVATDADDPSTTDNGAISFSIESNTSYTHVETVLVILVNVFL